MFKLYNNSVVLVLSLCLATIVLFLVVFFSFQFLFKFCSAKGIKENKNGKKRQFVRRLLQTAKRTIRKC